jgi:hypothetical protein
MKLLLLLLLTLASALPARADDFRFTAGDGWVLMRVPKEWEHDNLDRDWYSGFTPDRTVWISCHSFDWLTAERLQTWLPKHFESFGVTITLDWTTFRSAPGRLGRWSVVDCLLTGQTEDGPCQITLTIFEVDDKARFVVTTGGPPAQHAKYRAALQAILASVQRTTAPKLPGQ